MPLALSKCLRLLYLHIKSVCIEFFSCPGSSIPDLGYPHQPESHKLSLQKVLEFDHIGGYTFDTVQEEQYSDHSSTEVLLFLHVCLQVMLLDQSDIALFAFEITF